MHLKKCLCSLTQVSMGFPASLYIVCNYLYTAAYLALSFSLQSFAVSACAAGWTHLPHHAEKAFLTQHKAPYLCGFWCARGSWCRDRRISMRPSDSSRHQSPLTWPRENYPLVVAKNDPANPAKSPSCLLLSCWNSFPLSAPEILPALGSWSKGVTSDQGN